MIFVSLLLDLYSSPPEKGYVEAIREEVARVLEEEGGAWTKAGLARMPRLESAVKEAMRWRGTGPKIMSRKASYIFLYRL